MPRHPYLILLLIFLCATVWGSQRQTPASATPVETLTVGQLRATALQIGDLSGMVGTVTDWWPTLPEVYRRGMYTDPLAGEQGYVVNGFARAAHASERIESVMVLYDTPIAAQTAFAQLTHAANARTVKTTPLSWTGDACRYFAQKDGKLFKTTLRFRKGRLVSRLTMVATTAYTTPKTMLKYAMPLVARMARAQQHAVAEAVEPNSVTRLMPPTGIANIGPAVITTIIPAESWALLETTGTPLQILALLHKDGVRRMTYRCYSVPSLPNHKLDAVLFSFADTASATAWVKRSLSPSEPPSLPTGSVVPGPAWLLHYGKNDDVGSVYEYQFATGHYVCDVSVYATGSKTNPGSANVARQLAECWYQSLHKYSTSSQ